MPESEGAESCKLKIDPPGHKSHHCMLAAGHEGPCVYGHCEVCLKASGLEKNAKQLQDLLGTVSGHLASFHVFRKTHGGPVLSFDCCQTSKTFIESVDKLEIALLNVILDHPIISKVLDGEHKIKAETLRALHLAGIIKASDRGDNGLSLFLKGLNLKKD